MNLNQALHSLEEKAIIIDYNKGDEEYKLYKDTAEADTQFLLLLDYLTQHELNAVIDNPKVRKIEFPDVPQDPYVYQVIYMVLKQGKQVGELIFINDWKGNTRVLSAINNSDETITVYYVEDGKVEYLDAKGNDVVASSQNLNVQSEVSPQWTCEGICQSICSAGMGYEIGTCIARCMVGGPAYGWCLALCATMVAVTCGVGCDDICFLT